MLCNDWEIVLKICNETNSERTNLYSGVADMSIVELHTSVRFYDIASDNYSIWVSACASTMCLLY